MRTAALRWSGNRLLQWLLITTLLAFICLLSRSTSQAQSDPVSEIIRRVNALRASYGVPAYLIDSALMTAAQAQANWSAANDHIGHDGPDGSTPDDRAQAAGYGAGYRSYATENVAHGTARLNTPELVVTMWQGDWGHLNAMISPDYEHIGVGFAEMNGESWYVMMAGWVADGAPVGNAPAPATPVASTPYTPFELSEPDQQGAVYHEVQPGQTAWTIAAQYEVDLAVLLSQNNLTEDSLLYPGDMLLIRPPELPTPTPPPLPSSTPALPTSTPALLPTAVLSEPTVLPTQTANVLPTPTDAAAENSSPLNFFLWLGAGLLIVFLAGFMIKLQKP